MRTTICIGLAAGLLVLATLPRSAAGCEPGVCHQTILPADGAVGIPTNTKIWLFYQVGGDYAPTVTLYDAGGGVVATTAEYIVRGGLALIRQALLIVTPQMLLQPESAYTIEVSDAPICDNYDVPGDGIIRQRFDTGLLPDAEAPQPSGAIRVQASFIEEQPPNGPCDVGLDRFRYEITASAAEEASIYALYLDSTLVDVQTSPLLFYEEHGSGEIPARCFIVLARDCADNEEQNDREVCFEASSRDDGGGGDADADSSPGDVAAITDGATSADGAPATGGNPRANDGGCACRAASSSRNLLGWPLWLAVSCLFTKGRRHRSRQ